MKLWVTLQKTNTGRVVVSALRSTSEHGPVGTGWRLPPFNPNARAEIEDVLRGLGVEEVAIAEKMAALQGGAEFVRVAEVDAGEEGLREMGFA
ncbi:MAG: hypothetical protein H0X25_05420 [Acidobacteriales bacterium]|nr:hypothetical protein [Terriglobales bacterium]